MVAATGDLELRAHGGALSLPLRTVVIDRGELTIADPLEEAERRVLVTVDPDADEHGWRETRLAAASDILFLHTYLPGVPFGPLRTVPVRAS